MCACRPTGRSACSACTVPNRTVSTATTSRSPHPGPAHHRRNRRRPHQANLAAAVDARKLIGQAQGILMERFALDADQAFAVLRRCSQHLNIKLRDIAQQLINTRKLPEARARHDQ
jgi:hypothetical protein